MNDPDSPLMDEADRLHHQHVPADRAPVAANKIRVLRATAALLESSGYHAVTVDAVVRASGVSRSTIYRHWPSRQEIILDAFRWRTDEWTTVLDSGNVVVDIRTYLSKLAYSLNFRSAATIVPVLISEALRDESYARRLSRIVIRSRRRDLLVLLARGQQRGQVRLELDPAVVVDALYGAIHHRLLVTRQPIDDRFIAALMELIAPSLLLASPLTAGDAGKSKRDISAVSAPG